MTRHEILLCALLALGCGGGGTTATTTTPEPEAIPGPPAPWAEMTHDQRRAHMVAEVYPRMSAMFQEHDAERYADFSCGTCHGPDAAERNFEMPNPSLYALSPTGSDGQHQTVRDHPEMVRFMYNRVVPAMQTLIGAPEYDEATHEGFTCYACHPHAGAQEPAPP